MQNSPPSGTQAGTAGPRPAEGSNIINQKSEVMQKEFVKCYVAGKKAGIICDGSQFVLGHYFGAWNDGTITSDRHGFLKFAGLQARTIDEARAEIVSKFGELAEEGSDKYAAIRELCLTKNL